MKNLKITIYNNIEEKTNGVELADYLYFSMSKKNPY